MLSTKQIKDLLHQTYILKWSLSTARSRYSTAVYSHLSTLDSHDSVDQWLNASALGQASKWFAITCIRTALRREGHVNQASNLPRCRQPEQKKHDVELITSIQWSKLPPNLSALLQFLGHFGCRINEAYSCKVVDGVLILNATKTDSVIQWPIDSLPAEHQMVLLTWLDALPYYPIRRYYWDIETQRQAGNIPKGVTAHLFRYAFITERSERMSATDIAQAVGHRSIETTYSYIKSDRAKLALRVFA